MKPLTNAEKQARYRKRKALAPLRKAMGLDPITLHLTPELRAKVLQVIEDATTDQPDAERRAIIIHAMTSE